MAIVMTDLDVETADLSFPVADEPVPPTIVGYCSTMTRRLGLLAGIAPRDLPAPVPFHLPPILAG